VERLDLIHAIADIVENVVEAVLFAGFLGCVQDQGAIWANVVVDLGEAFCQHVEYRKKAMSLTSILIILRRSSSEATVNTKVHRKFKWDVRSRKSGRVMIWRHLNWKYTNYQ
jgi:hypothetical protein